MSEREEREIGGGLVHSFFLFQEPFTSIHIDLHDGFFDHGSRLFSSIARAWNNCQVDSSDVKVKRERRVCTCNYID